MKVEPLAISRAGSSDPFSVMFLMVFPRETPSGKYRLSAMGVHRSVSIIDYSSSEKLDWRSLLETASLRESRMEAVNTFRPFRYPVRDTSADDLIAPMINALFEAYQSERLADVLSQFDNGYSGVTAGGGLLDRNLLARSLAFDFGYMDGIRIAPQSLTVRPLTGGADVEIGWRRSVKRYLFRMSIPGAEVNERDQRTALSMRFDGERWLILGQAGDPLFGLSDPVTGAFHVREVENALESARLDALAREAALKYVNPPAGETRPAAAWSADEFARRAQEASEAILAAYQREDVRSLMDRISTEYRSQSSVGTNVDHFTLPLSLRCDFEIFDNFSYSAASEQFRVYPEVKQAEVIFLWDARARFLATNQDIIKRSRRTRLIFADEDGEAKVIRQDASSVTNGSLLFGRAEPSSCTAVVRADEGSTIGGGTFAVSGTSGATGGTDISSVISGDQTYSGDIVVEAGRTMRVDPGVTLNFAPGARLIVYGTLDATSATFRSTSGSPGSWQGILFHSGSIGTISSCSIRDATDAFHVQGGNVTLASPTLTNNIDGIEVSGGTVTLTNAAISGNTGANIFSTGGMLALDGTIQSTGTSNIVVNGGTLAINSGSTVTGGDNVLSLVSGSATISSATIRNPNALGTGISAIGGSLTIAVSTISDAGSARRGIDATGSTVSVTSSTISGFDNGASEAGIRASGGTVTISNSTISSNYMGVQLSHLSTATVTLNATSVQNNSSHGLSVSGGYFSMTGGNLRNNGGRGLIDNCGCATSILNAVNIQNNFSFAADAPLGCAVTIMRLTGCYIADNNGATGVDLTGGNCVTSGQLNQIETVTAPAATAN